MNNKTMPRKQASRMIDRVRELLARRTAPEKIEAILKDEFQVEPLAECKGEAHNPEVGGMIDNCGCCSPRWALTGDYVKVT